MQKIMVLTSDPHNGSTDADTVYPCNDPIHGCAIDSLTCPPGQVKDVSGKCVDNPCNNYESRVESILNIEGGYKSDSIDKNDPTNRGISTPTWNAYANSILGINPTKESLKNLTSGQAKSIYKAIYWDSMRLDDINDGDLRYLLFDSGVLSGTKNATKQLQQVLKELGSNIKIDGILGAETINVINSTNPIDLYNNYRLKRKNYLIGLCSPDSISYIKGYEAYLNGYKNRIEKFKVKTNNNKTNVNCN